ncbi:MAG: hypothetical protein A2147_00620 [Chloroflexi bacterium RBG_16_57_8]|nr:MAG: hypothetical protein A2147_00620 [Chloroflexi bacterium RBG_16_57_8]
MDRDNMSLESSMKVAGSFMSVAGLVGALLVVFVLPGNNYFTGVMLLMLAILLISGLGTLFVGLLLTYRRVIGRAIATPAILLSRLLGR